MSQIQLQLKNARSGGGGGTYKNNYDEGWTQQQQLQQSIDNFHNTGSFYPQPNLGFVMKRLLLAPVFKLFNRSTFLSSLNQNSCPVLDAEEIKKQEQKEAINKLYP